MGGRRVPLLAGLVVVALHPYWRGVAAISVSTMGWLATLKGLLLVAFPTTLLSVPPATIDTVNWWRAVYIAFALLGLYLTYVGWAPGIPTDCRLRRCGNGNGSHPR
ncbi:MAG: hypothetical protein ACRDTN_03720 [Mycobacterium sp.]